jgi:hypothetical protein
MWVGCPGLMQVVGAAVPVLREVAPDNVRVGGYANGFQTSTSEW